MSLQSCGADPRGVRVEWRDGEGGGADAPRGGHRVGPDVGERPQLGPLGAIRVGGGKERGGHGPAVHGLGEGGGGERGEQQQQQQQQADHHQQQHHHQQRGEDIPPKPPKPPPPPKAPKKPKKPRHFESSEEDDPPPHPTPSPRPTPPPPTPGPPPLENRGRDPYGNVPGVGDTQYVPWAEGGNGGTVSQVTVLGDWDEELYPGDWWVVSQGSNGEGREKGKKGKKRKREKEGGTFRVPGGLLFHTREEAEAHLWGALKEGDDGDDGDDKGDQGDDKGEGGDKGGEVGGTRGVRRKGTRGVRRGVPGARMHPGNPPARTRGSLRVATRERGPGGQGG